MAGNKSTITACDDPTSLICKLCNKTYQHKDGPLLLPCLHSFCKPCLISYIKKEDSTSNISCPTCGAEFTPPRDISELPINLRLVHLLESLLYEKQASTDDVACQVCDEELKQATHFCSNCYKFLCTKCKNYHQRLISDDDILHEFVDLAQFEKGDFKIHSPPAKCPQHKEKFVLFCEDCNILICLLCAQTRDHLNHMKISINDTAEKEKLVLQEKAKDVGNALNTMDGALKQVEEMQRRVVVSSKEANATINKACDELIRAVEERRKTLKKKCKEVTEGKSNVLSNQMIEIQQLRKDLTFAQAHVKDAVDNQTPEEILSMKKSIHHRLNQAMEQYQLQSLDMREDDVINVSMDIEPIIQNIQQATIVQDASEQRDNPIINNDVCMCVQYQSKNSVQPSTNTASYQKLLMGSKVNVILASTIVLLLSIIVISYCYGGVDSNPPLKVRNYTTFPSIQPTYRNVGGKCYGVAVHRDGTIYATTSSYPRRIKVFRPDGTASEFDGSDDTGGKLYDPRGIGILNDTIYVADHGNHSVSMFSIDGKFIGRFGTNGSGNGQFYYPTSICVDTVGRRILTTESRNNRIQFLTPRGTFIKSIQLPSRACDVAIDNQGNIHVVLCDKGEIAVYSEADNDGLIETYNLAGRMKRPTGLYIDPAGNRLISTDQYNNEFYITDPTGQLITIFYTNSAGNGICMDNEQNVYVAERNSKRVAIY